MRPKVRFALGTVVLIATAALSVAHVMATDTSPRVLRAIEAQEALIENDPTDSTAYNDLGNLLSLAERFDAAEAAYRRAIELAPYAVAPHYNLALLLQQRGDSAAAVTELQTVLELEPTNAWAHYQLGADLERRGLRKAAIDHYARAFALDHALTFAENNPHIIENRLVTRAMLESQRYSNPLGAQVPRRYDDAERIARLILQPLAAPATLPPEPMAAADEALDGDDGDDSDPAALPRLDTGGAAQPAGVPGAAATAPSARKLSADDLDGTSRAGQAGATAGGANRTSPSRVLDRYRRSSGSQVQPADPGERRRTLPSNRLPGGATADPSGGRQTTPVPSRRSTASLGLELRPAAGPA